jgi:hypothetical protein
MSFLKEDEILKFILFFWSTIEYVVVHLSCKNLRLRFELKLDFIDLCLRIKLELTKYNALSQRCGLNLHGRRSRRQRQYGPS